MNKDDFKELEKLFWEFKNNECKETASELKYFLNYCAKQINLKKIKSNMLKF